MLSLPAPISGTYWAKFYPYWEGYSELMKTLGIRVSVRPELVVREEANQSMNQIEVSTMRYGKKAPKGGKVAKGKGAVLTPAPIAKSMKAKGK